MRLFADEFDDPQSGWDVGDFDHGWVDYEEGVFVFYAYGPDDILWSQLNQSSTIRCWRSKLRRCRRPQINNVIYGVACQVDDDGFGGYLFLITADGAYAILKDTVKE